MTAALPLDGLMVGNAKERFIDQRRRLEAMAGAFSSHVAPSQPAKLVINDGHQLFERSPVSFTPGAEKRACVLNSAVPGLSGVGHTIGAIIPPDPTTAFALHEL